MEAAYNETTTFFVEINTIKFHSFVLKRVDYFKNMIEANEKSGTLITARLALDYGRDVLAVPGSIFSPVSRGTNQLIRQGAESITASRDLLEALGLETKTVTAEEFTKLSPLEQKVIQILGGEAIPRDYLIGRLNLSASEANQLIGLLEIKGVIEERLGAIRLTSRAAL